MSTYGLWLSAAGMQVNEHRQTVLANNLANAQTTGFKHDLAVVQQRPVASRESAETLPLMHPVLDGIGGGLATRPVFTSFEQGAIEQTGRDLDLAIHGDGFFAVSDGDNVRYTRDGVMTLGPDGEIVLAAGEGKWRLLDSGGAPVRVDPALGDVRVTPDGMVRQGDAIVAELQPVTAENLHSMRKVGENLFEHGGENMVPAAGRVVSRAKEHSTFDPMRGLASMIEASRAYEMNARMLQLQDHATGQAISRVGRV